MRKSVCHIVNILIFINMVLLTNGTPCYSNAQKVCHNMINPFWVAVIKKDNSEICLHLQPMYDCIVQSEVSCDFVKEDEELFESDVVQVYTKPPYNCPLSRTKAQQSASHQGERNKAIKAALSPVILVSFVLTFSVNL